MVEAAVGRWDVGWRAGAARRAAASYTCTGTVGSHAHRGQYRMDSIGQCRLPSASWFGQWVGWCGHRHRPPSSVPSPAGAGRSDACMGPRRHLTTSDAPGSCTGAVRVVRAGQPASQPSHQSSATSQRTGDQSRAALAGPPPPPVARRGRGRSHAADTPPGGRWPMASGGVVGCAIAPCCLGLPSAALGGHAAGCRTRPAAVSCTLNELALLGLPSPHNTSALTWKRM